MALIKRGNVYHVRKMVDGITIARSTKTGNKRVAEQLEAQWTAEVFNEVVLAGRRPVTVEKAIATFLESRRGTAGYCNAEIKLRFFKPFFSRMLHDITEAEIRSQALTWVEQGYSINTVNVSLIYWNSVQNHATKIGFTSGKKVKRLKGGGGKLRFLSEDEIAVLLNELNPANAQYREKRKAQDNYDFTLLLLHTGAREQEVAKLSMAQIDQTAGTLTIFRSKGGTDTTLKMSAAVIEIIARRQVAAEQPLAAGQTLHGRIGNGFLIPERAKARYNNEYLAKACERCGLKDVTLHTLRHTFATKMLKAGLSLPEVQHLLGHRNINSTAVYAHLVPNLTANKAAEILNA